jgi:HlyD family secretion protein
VKKHPRFVRARQRANALVPVTGQLRRVPVKPGTEITPDPMLDGLKEGDEVILYPGDRVADGARVNPVKI